MNLPVSESELRQREIVRNGFTIVENAIDGRQVAQWIEELEHLFASNQAAIKNRAGAVYAARNILSSLPACCDIGKVNSLHELLLEILGSNFGLVRGLYFDKHPDRTWSLPWHKDLTIAVKDNTLPSSRFIKPTRKSGVDHVEAPENVLESMLTLRIHLDDVTTENGPLEVAVGSHTNGKRPSDSHESKLILVDAGDVWRCGRCLATPAAAPTLIRKCTVEFYIWNSRPTKSLETVTNGINFYEPLRNLQANVDPVFKRF